MGARLAWGTAGSIGAQLDQSGGHSWIRQEKSSISKGGDTAPSSPIQRGFSKKSPREAPARGGGRDWGHATSRPRCAGRARPVRPVV